MQRFLLILGLVLVPVLVLAQTYSSAPLLVVNTGAAAKVSVPPGESGMAASAENAAAKAAAALAPAAGQPAPVTQESLLKNYPEAAITRVGENSGAGHVDAPANPPSPPAPANPAAPISAASPANPPSPTPPASPPSKLWPRNTLEIFMPPCTGLRPAFIKPCTCVITKLMVEMPHDEFLAKSEAGTIEQDARLMKIRQDCATAPKQKE